MNVIWMKACWVCLWWFTCHVLYHLRELFLPDFPQGWKVLLDVSLHKEISLSWSSTDHSLKLIKYLLASGSKQFSVIPCISSQIPVEFGDLVAWNWLNSGILKADTLKSQISSISTFKKWIIQSFLRAFEETRINWWKIPLIEFFSNSWVLWLNLWIRYKWSITVQA